MAKYSYILNLSFCIMNVDIAHYGTRLHDVDRGMRHTSTALYFYEPEQAQGHFWEYVISDKLWF